MKVVFIVLLIIILLILVLLYYLEILRMFKLKHQDIFNLDKAYSTKNKVLSDSRVVISLTTTPTRIFKCGNMLKSILDQTVRVDAIYLNVPYVSRKNGLPYKIPDFLTKLKSVIINRCQDTGPSTKLLPILKLESPKTRIIYLDDDRIYGSKMVESLVSASNKNPNSAFCISGYKILWKDDRKDSFIMDIDDASIFKINSGYKKVDIMMGFGASLVRPFMFNNDEIYDYDNAPKEAVHDDDAWISGHLARNNIPRYRLEWDHNTIPLSSSLDEGLSGTVNSNNYNTKKIIEHFKSAW